METKNIIAVGSLPLPEKLKNRISQSFSTYAASGIIFEITGIENDTATIIVTQKELLNGYILNNHQLYLRAKEVFEGIDKLKFNILPSVFSLQVENITEEWILAKMEEFGIKRNDLVKQLAFDKSYISLLFADQSNKRKVSLSKPMKATFFYYFLTYELNRDFRQD